MFRPIVRSIPPIVCVAAAIANTAAVRGEGPAGLSDSAAVVGHASAADLDHRQREGSQMNQQTGHFTLTGDRLTFHLSQSQEQYLGLENLAMERIAKVVSERHAAAEQIVWEVTGVFTEYRGNNYLLITHAIIKNEGASRRPKAAAP